MASQFGGLIQLSSSSSLFNWFELNSKPIWAKPVKELIGLAKPVSKLVKLAQFRLELGLLSSQTGAIWAKPVKD